MTVVEAQDVAVVFVASFDVGQGRVGLAYAHEASRGVGVRVVVVWVVRFGEGVKGPGATGGKLCVSGHGEVWFSL